MSKVFADVQSDPEYLQAIEFAQKYTPLPDVDYEWVVRHSEEEYKRFETIADGLDEKADSLTRYLGLLVSLMAAAFTYNLADGTRHGLFQVIPSLIAMLVAISFALKARMPEISTLPLPAKEAFSYAEYFTKSAVAEVSCAAMTVAASVGLRLQNEKKGCAVRRSFQIFLCSIAWLVIAPVLTLVWQHRAPVLSVLVGLYR